ncbi:hypothetical protein LOK74_10830 [Brevibacillus humidisoli]|uniref:hypothetical protein n=1 Tax=Brevibacillus humidisoli TaxID=2895522 RepID=UPI001E65B23A|nr:hypothetical protein [Brevibacillus humidisoli]UFJ42948.1 hypothetical protein LOK74_10830 [Brevibacillus humidisoli]
MNVRLWAVCLLLITSLGSHTFAADADPDSNWNSHFQQQIKHWIEDLSSKDEKFAVWKGARTEVQALGVHSRQWLIRLSKEDSYVGYLVVGEAPDPDLQQPPEKPTFVLLEYGLGEFILFHDAFAPLQIAAEPVYDGFASHWEVALDAQHQQYIDAKTGEKYPSTVEDPPPLVMPTLPSKELIRSDGLLTRHHTVSQEATDPFDRIDWVKAAPLATDESGGWRGLWQNKEQRIVVTASLFQNQVFAPFTVGSIHVWNDSIAYIGVWDEGLRYLPASYVTKVGKLVAS